MDRVNHGSLVLTKDGREKPWKIRAVRYHKDQKPLHCMKPRQRYMIMTGESMKTLVFLGLLVISGSIGLGSGVMADGCTSCQFPFPMTASFIGSPLVGTAPMTVTFLDTSTQSPDTWLWNFGDSSSSKEQNPVHTYAKAGTYRVTLSVSSAKQEDSVTREGYVIVRDSQKSGTAVSSTPKPTPSPTVRVTPVSVPSGPVTQLDAAFSMNISSGTAPLAVAFTDRSTGTITNRIFDFGDGSNATGTNPVHVYQRPGSFTVTLFITGPGGASVAQVLQAVRVMGTLPTPVRTKIPVTPTKTKKPFSSVKLVVPGR
jgi:large repetitive protein